MKKLHALSKQFNCSSSDESPQYKLIKLSIDNDRRQELINIPCKYCNFIGINEVGKLESTLEIISLDKLKGWNRPDGVDKVNWLECLEGLHKLINFHLYINKEEFERFLNNVEYCNKMFGLPEVIEYKNEYFISGNGKHRLTIAKCVGIKEAPALVKKIR